MKGSPKLAGSVLAVLATHAAAVRADSNSPGNAGNALSEIVVTAQRRTENIQDVPITIQALTGDSLAQLNATTLDDFLRYLPNVTQASAGPGQGNIYIRGLAYGFGGTQSSGSAGDLPTVAVYLDDQSAQLPGRNLDIYAADLERIELLEGPQGTLFGGGAQAGVIRYITNKPQLNGTTGSVEATYGTTAGGDPNAAATAVLNLPLIPDTLAVRGVVYSDRRGGYINNVPSTFSRQGTDLGLASRNGGTVDAGGNVTVPGQVPADSVTINNYGIARNAINPVTYQGARLSALYKVNDAWDVLVTQTFQTMDAEGVFYANPVGSDGRTLPANSVSLFNPSYNKDRFENTAIVINGTIGGVKLAYSGAYLVRNVDQIQDYTNYARGVWATYYQCTGYSAGFDPISKCYSPSAIWHETERNTHLSQELRLSTPDDRRIRGVGGVYWEDYQIYDQTDWLEKSVPTCSATINTQCFLNVAPIPGTPANNPNMRNDADGFFEDTHRDYRQLAFFGSVDVDIVPKILTLTVGTRHFKYDYYEKGSVVSSFGCKIYAGATATSPGPCPPNQYATNLGALPVSSTQESGFRSRASLSWKPADGLLIYYTWSQGFRPGGFNQSTGRYLPDANGIPQFILPPTYKSDDLVNNELGWKTEWFGRRLQFNGSLYREKWTNQQTGFFDPQGGLGNVAFQTNGPSYEVKGVEMSLEARLTKGLTVSSAASWNSSSQTNSPYLVNNNPESPGFGQNITSIPNPYGPLGSPLPNSPAFSGNVRLRYDWSLGDGDAFWQLGAEHRGHSYSATGNVNAYDQPALTTYDGGIGLSRDVWNVGLYGHNLTNVTKGSSVGSPQFLLENTPLRPRVLELKISYRLKAKS